MYRFVKIQCHPKVESLWGWYLAINRADNDLFMNIHRRVAQGMFMKYHRDPHLFDQRTFAPVAEHSWLYNPVALAAGWLETAGRLIDRRKTIYVNSAGGLLIDPPRILAERASEKLEWPPGMAQIERERIRVLQWGGGSHYYLKGTTRTVFSQDKYDSLHEALTEARLYATEENITVEEPRHTYRREGD